MDTPSSQVEPVTPSCRVRHEHPFGPAHVAVASVRQFGEEGMQGRQVEHVRQFGRERLESLEPGRDALRRRQRRQDVRHIFPREDAIAGGQHHGRGVPLFQIGRHPGDGVGICEVCLVEQDELRQPHLRLHEDWAHLDEPIVIVGVEHEDGADLVHEVGHAFVRESLQDVAHGRHARRLDHNAVGGVGEGDVLELGHEVHLQTAADAAARQLAHGALTVVEQRPVDSHFPELVHQDHRARGIERLLAKLVQYDGGLPRSEEASDDIYEHDSSSEYLPACPAEDTRR